LFSGIRRIVVGQNKIERKIGCTGGAASAAFATRLTSRSAELRFGIPHPKPRVIFFNHGDQRSAAAAPNTAGGLSGATSTVAVRKDRRRVEVPRDAGWQLLVASKQREGGRTFKPD